MFSFQGQDFAKINLRSKFGQIFGFLSKNFQILDQNLKKKNNFGSKLSLIGQNLSLFS